MKNFICPRCYVKNDLLLVKKGTKYDEFKCSVCSLKIKFKGRG